MLNVSSAKGISDHLTILIETADTLTEKTISLDVAIKECDESLRKAKWELCETTNKVVVLSEKTGELASIVNERLVLLDTKLGLLDAVLTEFKTIAEHLNTKELYPWLPILVVVNSLLIIYLLATT